jgi:hypothetical protein
MEEEALTARSLGRSVKKSIEYETESIAAFFSYYMNDQYWRIPIGSGRKVLTARRSEG